MKLSSKSIGATCIVTWLGFMTVTSAHWPESTNAKLLGAATLILVTHILYAGYFLTTRLPKIDTRAALLAAMIGLLILLSPLTFSDYRLVALDFVILFVAAMMLHQEALVLNVSPKVNQLARYKIRLELAIIIIIGLQTLLIWRFSHHEATILGFGLVFLLACNALIIFKDQIYRKLA